MRAACSACRNTGAPAAVRCWQRVCNWKGGKAAAELAILQACLGAARVGWLKFPATIHQPYQSRHRTLHNCRAAKSSNTSWLASASATQLACKTYLKSAPPSPSLHRRRTSAACAAAPAPKKDTHQPVSKHRGKHICKKQPGRSEAGSTMERIAAALRWQVHSLRLWLTPPHAHQVRETKLCGRLCSLQRWTCRLVLLPRPLSWCGRPRLACACRCSCWGRRWGWAAACLLPVTLCLPFRLLLLHHLLLCGPLPARRPRAGAAAAAAAAADAVAAAGGRAPWRAAWGARCRWRGCGAAAQVRGVLLAHLEAERFHAHSVCASLQCKWRVPSWEQGRLGVREGAGVSGGVGRAGSSQQRGA